MTIIQIFRKWVISSVLFGCGVLLAACAGSSTPSGPTENQAQTTQLKAKGDSAAKIAQAVLLTRVMQAVQQGGAAHAVAYCNLNASTLTDSLPGLSGYRIQRISDKYRNPANRPKTTGERTLLENYSRNKAAKLSLRDTVLYEGKKAVYYKPILIGMPTCLKCHGNPDSDIDAQTFAVLREKYPKDRATGYQTGDFRGLWKISFQKN